MNPATLIAWALKNWVSIICAVGLAAAVGGLSKVLSDNAALRVQVSDQRAATLRQQQRADSNAQIAAALQSDVDHMHEAAAAAALTRQQFAALRANLIGRITNAPASADGPLAPVLADTLRELHNADAARAAAGSDPRPH